ncbi:MAG: ABC transporter permease [Gammaproteobacteria bacterium]|nr:ABC transporter permease [Gammaproteobacteria bacterium]
MTSPTLAGSWLARLPRPRGGAFIVWLRNLLVWRKLMAAGLFLAFGEPFVYLLGLGYGLGRFIGDLDGLSYLSFLASGLLASSAMNASSFEGMYSVFTRMTHQQTYDAILATPLSVDDIVAGEMLWCATKSVIVTIPILVVAALLGAVAGPSALLAIPVFFGIGLCFAGPAMVMAALAPSYDFFNYYVTLLITPMFIFSGVFYPVTALPAAAQVFVGLLPLSHAVQLLRPLVAGLPPENVGLHLAVLLGYALVGYLAATWLVRRRMIH